MFILLSNDKDFTWSNMCQKAFASLKMYISKSLIFHGTNRTIPLHISIDASDIGIRVVLGQ